MLFLLLACSEPPAPAAPVAPSAPAAPPPAPAPAPDAPFDCAAWGADHHMPVDMCGESPHLPGLYLLQSKAGGATHYVAVKGNTPLKGGGAAVAAFLRGAAAWDHPVTGEDVGGVLTAFGSFPPGFTSQSPSTFEPPFTYVLTESFEDWQGHGGPNSVAGAMPTGPKVRATLSGSATTPIQWIVESGSGATWSPVATIQWDRGPAPSAGR